jgi:TRAP-type C4-dicarboxylate transport system permease small subunit
MQTTHQTKEHKSLPLADATFVRMVRRSVQFVTVFGVASYTILVCVQVFFRYALNSSVTWSEEAVGMILLWTVMLGSALATDSGAHLALTPLDGRVSKAGQMWIRRVAAMCSIVFCMILMYYGALLVHRTRFMSSSAADIPMAYVYTAMPAGALLITFFAVVHLLDGTVHQMDPIEDRS